MISLPLHDRGLPKPGPALPVHDAVEATAIRSPLDHLGLLGLSGAIERVRKAIVRYAPTRAEVLVHGETGTGKELVARALHACSRRPGGPFVAVNAAALPLHLLVSLLFGHERGSFTGAAVRHRGLFEQAHGGTLFLDEVGELGVEAQAHLLRVLETGVLHPLGAERTRAVDVRVVAATHRDLWARVREGLFREDLHHRLHALRIDVPPLRERPDDLLPLARHLLATLRAEVGERRLTDEARESLASYAWPGNVRQLRNVLLRAAIDSDAPMLGAREIRAALASEPNATLPSDRGRPPAAAIEATLRATRGNIARASRELGLPRSTLRDHLRRFGLQPEPPALAASQSP